MPALLSILLALVAATCTAVLLWGVYIDHVRQRRQRRSWSRYRTYAQHQQIRSEALQVIGGSNHGPVTGETYLGKQRLP